MVVCCFCGALDVARVVGVLVDERSYGKILARLVLVCVVGCTATCQRVRLVFLFYHIVVPCEKTCFRSHRGRDEGG